MKRSWKIGLVTGGVVFGVNCDPDYLPYNISNHARRRCHETDKQMAKGYPER